MTILDYYMLKNKGIYFFLLLCLLSKSLLSQTPNHISIGVDVFEGVDIYSIAKHNDLLYVSTNKGLYKQQYNSFVLVPSKLGESQSLFDLKEDNRGDLFCKSLSGKIFKLYDDSLDVFYELDKVYYKSLFYYFFDDENNLITTGDSIMRIRTNGIRENLSNIFTCKTKMKSFFSHKNFKGDIFISAACDNKYAYLYRNGQIEKFNCIFQPKNIGGDMYLYEKNNASFVIHSDKNIYSPTNSFSEVNLIYKERFILLNDGNLLGLSSKDGARVIDLINDTLKEIKHFFENQFLSCAFHDSDGVLYFGTFGDGIKVVPNYNQTKIKIDGISDIAKNINDNPVVSTRKGEIIEINNGKTNLIDLAIKRIDNLFYTEMPLGSSIQKKHHVIYRTPTFNLGAIKGICSISDSLVVFADHVSINAVSYKYQLANPILNNFREMPDVLVKPFYKRFKREGRYYDVTYNSNKQKIYATNGNDIIDVTADKEMLVNNKSVKCHKLTMYKDKIVAGSIDDGVLFIKDNRLIDSLTVNHGLKSNFVKQISIFNDDLFILTSKGLQVFNLLNKELFDVNNKHGIDALSIIAFQIIEDEIWLVTKNSCFNILISEVVNKKKRIVFTLDSLFVNNKIESFSNKSFNHKSNKFSFTISCKDLLLKKDAKYRYRLIGFDADNKFLSAEENVINYEYLPPGEYTFCLQMLYNNVVSENKNYSFTIQKPFYQMWWFYLFLFLLTSGFVMVIYHRRIKQIQKKNNEKLEKEILSKNLLDSELKALRSQMNPHFIFNSLNSIQSLVLNQDVDKSYDYIAMFAELVRSTLNYSEQEFIPIDKELRFLKVYLDLEKLRFKEDFNYTINYNGPKTIQVPSILIQPFIENSLKHGLLHKKGQKTLSITLEFSDKLICRIIDNGIGRQLSNKIKKQNKNAHDSFSMNAINKRLEILSEQYQGEFYYSVIDLLEDEIPAGTEIVLTMPYKK